MSPIGVEQIIKKFEELGKNNERKKTIYFI